MNLFNIQILTDLTEGLPSKLLSILILLVRASKGHVLLRLDLVALLDV